MNTLSGSTVRRFGVIETLLRESQQILGVDDLFMSYLSMYTLCAALAPNWLTVGSTFQGPDDDDRTRVSTAVPSLARGSQTNLAVGTTGHGITHAQLSRAASADIGMLSSAANDAITSIPDKHSASSQTSHSAAVNDGRAACHLHRRLRDDDRHDHRKRPRSRSRSRSRPRHRHKHKHDHHRDEQKRDRKHRSRSRSKGRRRRHRESRSSSTAASSSPSSSPKPARQKAAVVASDGDPAANASFIAAPSSVSAAPSAGGRATSSYLQLQSIGWAPWLLPDRDLPAYGRPYQADIPTYESRRSSYPLQFTLGARRLLSHSEQGNVFRSWRARAAGLEGATAALPKAGGSGACAGGGDGGIGGGVWAQIQADTRAKAAAAAAASTLPSMHRDRYYGADSVAAHQDAVRKGLLHLGDGRRSRRSSTGRGTASAAPAAAVVAPQDSKQRLLLAAISEGYARQGMGGSDVVMAGMDASAASGHGNGADHNAAPPSPLSSPPGAGTTWSSSQPSDWFMAVGQNIEDDGDDAGGGAGHDGSGIAGSAAPSSAHLRSTPLGPYPAPWETDSEYSLRRTRQLNEACARFPHDERMWTAMIQWTIDAANTSSGGTSTGRGSSSRCTPSPPGPLFPAPSPSSCDRAIAIADAALVHLPSSIPTHRLRMHCFDQLHGNSDPQAVTREWRRVCALPGCVASSQLWIARLDWARRHECSNIRGDARFDIEGFRRIVAEAISTIVAAKTAAVEAVASAASPSHAPAGDALAAYDAACLDVLTALCCTEVCAGHHARAVSVWQALFEVNVGCPPELITPPTSSSSSSPSPSPPWPTRLLWFSAYWEGESSPRIGDTHPWYGSEYTRAVDDVTREIRGGEDEKEEAGTNSKPDAADDDGENAMHQYLSEVTGSGFARWMEAAIEGMTREERAAAGLATSSHQVEVKPKRKSRWDDATAAVTHVGTVGAAVPSASLTALSRAFWLGEQATLAMDAGTAVATGRQGGGNTSAAAVSCTALNSASTTSPERGFGCLGVSEVGEAATAAAAPTVDSEDDTAVAAEAIPSDNEKNVTAVALPVVSSGVGVVIDTVDERQQRIQQEDAVVMVYSAVHGHRIPVKRSLLVHQQQQQAGGKDGGNDDGDKEELHGALAPGSLDLVDDGGDDDAYTRMLVRGRGNSKSSSKSESRAAAAATSVTVGGVRVSLHPDLSVWADDHPVAMAVHQADKQMNMVVPLRDMCCDAASYARPVLSPLVAAVRGRVTVATIAAASVPSSSSSSGWVEVDADTGAGAVSDGVVVDEEEEVRALAHQAAVQSMSMKCAVDSCAVPSSITTAVDIAPFLFECHLSLWAGIGVRLLECIGLHMCNGDDSYGDGGVQAVLLESFKPRYDRPLEYAATTAGNSDSGGGGGVRLETGVLSDPARIQTIRRVLHRLIVALPGHPAFRSALIQFEALVSPASLQPIAKHVLSLTTSAPPQQQQSTSPPQHHLALNVPLTHFPLHLADWTAYADSLAHIGKPGAADKVVTGVLQQYLPSNDQCVQAEVCRIVAGRAVQLLASDGHASKAGDGSGVAACLHLLCCLAEGRYAQLSPTAAQQQAIVTSTSTSSSDRIMQARSVCKSRLSQEVAAVMLQLEAGVTAWLQRPGSGLSFQMIGAAEPSTVRLLDLFLLARADTVSPSTPSCLASYLACLAVLEYLRPGAQPSLPTTSTTSTTDSHRHARDVDAAGRVYHRGCVLLLTIIDMLLAADDEVKVGTAASSTRYAAADESLPASGGLMTVSVASALPFCPSTTRDRGIARLLQQQQGRGRDTNSMAGGAGVGPTQDDAPSLSPAQYKAAVLGLVNGAVEHTGVAASSVASPSELLQRLGRPHGIVAAIHDATSPVARRVCIRLLRDLQWLIRHQVQLLTSHHGMNAAAGPGTSAVVAPAAPPRVLRRVLETGLAICPHDDWLVQQYLAQQLVVGEHEPIGVHQVDEAALPLALGVPAGPGGSGRSMDTSTARVVMLHLASSLGSLHCPPQLLTGMVDAGVAELHTSPGDGVGQGRSLSVKSSNVTPRLAIFRRLFAAILHQSSSLASCSTSLPLLWRQYLRFELLSRRHSAAPAAYLAYLRGMAACPWSLALRSDGARRLGPYLAHDVQQQQSQ